MVSDSAAGDGGYGPVDGRRGVVEIPLVTDWTGAEVARTQSGRGPRRYDCVSWLEVEAWLSLGEQCLCEREKRHRSRDESCCCWNAHGLCLLGYRIYWRLVEVFF